MLRPLVMSVLVTGSLAIGAGPVAAQCAGDCSGDGSVSVDEIVRGVSIALGTAEVTTCGAIDTDSNGQVTVDEVITAVNKALGGCGNSPTPTPTQPPAGTPTATVSVPGCSNGNIEASFTSAVDTNADTSTVSLTLTAAAQVRDPRSGAYLWGITGNLCDASEPLLRSVQIQLIGPRMGFAPGSYPLNPPLGSLVYIESPAFGSVQPRIWTTTGTTLVIDSVAGSSLTFHVDAAPMVPNLIVAGDPPPRGTFNLSAAGTLGFTSQ